MKIHREGYGIILITTLILAGLFILTQYLAGEESIITAVVLILCIVVLGLVVQFFRNPSRIFPTEENLVIAPADGKVVVIEETTETEYLNDRRIQVSIFMSPVNVHVNRNPVSGRVEYYKYHPGKYLVAWHPKSSTENERTTVVVETLTKQKVLFRQIAGALARRIKCYVKEGQAVRRGTEFGFIKFGSRVDIFLPVGTKILVEIGQKTKGGVTPIAEL
ncbi:MAG TPA: phosphatidylserine decarboxylase family protein [Bacteroidia bacterium]|nr:phosphatidylserine decarboxylase family protein [Bacteroidia bacterium]